jgi:hypothetical protein
MLEDTGMKCWNCLKALPETAQACPFCEAAVEDEPTPEEMAAVQGLLNQMPSEALTELQALIEQSTTAQEFANAIFVGECPKCAGSETGDCESDPEIDNLLVGRCYQCGVLFCSDCHKLLDPKTPDCPCWDEEIEF